MLVSGKASRAGEETWSRRYGRYALVTGAAKGLGAAFAQACADRDLDPILVDIDEAGLREQQAIHCARGRDAHRVVVDLRRKDAHRIVLDQLAPEVRDDIGLLIANAGRTSIERFLDRSLEEHLGDLHVNVRSTLCLTHCLARQMARRQRGGVVIVSSASALTGSPLVAQYAATKAYDLVLAEGIAEELHPLGVDVLALMPGPTKTPGWDSVKPRRVLGVSVMESREVAKEALAALGKRTTLIAGRENRLAYGLLARLPRRLARKVVGSTVYRMFAR
jgi:short-subunit dehydrogenase